MSRDDDLTREQRYERSARRKLLEQLRRMELRLIRMASICETPDLKGFDIELIYLSRCVHLLRAEIRKKLIALGDKAWDV